MGQHFEGTCELQTETNTEHLFQNGSDGSLNGGAHCSGQHADAQEHSWLRGRNILGRTPGEETLAVNTLAV